MEEIIDSEFEEEYNKLVESESILPIKITDFYKKKVIEEISKIGKGGPLYESVITKKKKININFLLKKISICLSMEWIM